MPSATSSAQETQKREKKYRPDKEPGDLIQDYNAAIVVPEEGLAVVAFVTTEIGHETLTVGTEEDGDVYTYDEGDEDADSQGEDEGDGQSPPPLARAQSGDVDFQTSECSDGAYGLAGFKANSFRWGYRTLTTPGGLDPTGTSNQLKSAKNNITNETNSCGRSDTVSATNTFDTTVNYSGYPEISGSGACNTLDAYNEVGFGDAGSCCPAITCLVISGGMVVTADTVMNKVEFGWTLNPGGACSGKWDVQGVHTHEAAHIYGLNDLANHPNLIMGQQVNNGVCSTAQRTLGYGDMLGLEALY
jgi:hypothetical protein